MPGAGHFVANWTLYYIAQQQIDECKGGIVKRDPIHCQRVVDQPKAEIHLDWTFSYFSGKCRDLSPVFSQPVFSAPRYNQTTNRVSSSKKKKKKKKKKKERKREPQLLVQVVTAIISRTCTIFFQTAHQSTSMQSGHYLLAKLRRFEVHRLIGCQRRTLWPCRQASIVLAWCTTGPSSFDLFGWANIVTAILTHWLSFSSLSYSPIFQNKQKPTQKFNDSKAKLWPRQRAESIGCMLAMTPRKWPEQDAIKMATNRWKVSAVKW